MSDSLLLDADYAALPDSVRREVRSWLNELTPISSGSFEGTMEDVLRSIGERMGTSLPTVRRKLYGLRQKNWRGLVNWAKVPKEQKLSPVFVDYWKKLCEDNQRNCKTAYKILIHKWRNTDEEIPGYKTPPPAAVGGVPFGWSYRNLMRYQPTKFELTSARQGRTAAACYRPMVFSTRVNLECGQFYMFDDLEHDIKVNFIGVNRQAWRPLELCALDLFSGCKIAYGTKPTIEGDDGAKQKLKERDMRFLLAYIMTNIGYRRAGTTLIVEHGTAAIREDVERMLFECTGGAVTVQRSGIEGAPALCGWYDGRGKGNFRMKAALESHHSLVHNVTAQLPGQMGLSRDASPEELHGRDQINKNLLKAVETLPPERAALIKFPFLHHQQFCQILGHIYRFINARYDHDLEGFAEAGLVTQEYRLSIHDKHWLPSESFLKLAPGQQEAVSQLIQSPGLVRCRKLSPWEVWSEGQKNLVKLPVWNIPDILGEDLAVEMKVDNAGMFAFEDKDLGPGTFRYLARATNRNGREELLGDGEKYRCFVNPFALDQLIVCTEAGGFIGTCRRIEAIAKEDSEALFRAMGDAAHSEVVRLGEYRARHQADVDQKKEDEAWNKKVISGAPVLPEEKAKAKSMKGYKMADLLGDDDVDSDVVEVEECGAEKLL